MDNTVKKLLKTSLLLILACFIVSPLVAQSTRKSMKAGNKLFNNENYRAAIPHYEEVLAKEPDNAEALFKAGVSYLSYDKEKSSDYIYRAHRLKPNVAKDVEYWMGRTDHINYNFDNAIKHFQNYQATLKKKNDPRKEEVAMLIQHSKNAKQQFNNQKDIFVKLLPAPINTKYSEHSPVIASDDSYLLYTSRGEAVTGGKKTQEGEYFEDLFESRRIGPEEWETPRSISGKLNSKGHDATIQLFDNDTKLLLYRQDNNGTIMYATKDANGDWSSPTPLNNNINSRDFESDAYITPDGKRIYFSTSHYSENGDLDIYYADREANGDWGKAKSMGNTINTPYDDDSPYLSRDGRTFYFASRGHNTMGGYDIFVSRYDTVARKWTRPENMGYPVNTPDDDTYYRLSPDGSYAYLSSYRIGGYGEKDIYTINYIRNVQVKGHVYSLRDSTVIPGVELVFSGQQADKKAISYRDVTKPDSGNYAVTILSGRKYQVAVSKDGQSITTEEFEVPVVTNDTTVITKDFYVPYVDTTAAARFAFKKIYFDTDKYNLRAASIRELDNIASVLKANPGINISIEGHCDSRASDEYNMVLGQNRANAAYNYLRKKGIAEGRMVKESFGERRPAAPNDSPENMQLNRRTEFRIVSGGMKAPANQGGTQNRNLNQGTGTRTGGATGTGTGTGTQNLQPGTKIKTKAPDSKSKVEYEKDGNLKIKGEDGKSEMKIKTKPNGDTKIKTEDAEGNEQKIEIEKDGDTTIKTDPKKGKDSKIKND